MELIRIYNLYIKDANEEIKTLHIKTIGQRHILKTFGPRNLNTHVSVTMLAIDLDS